MNFLCTHFLLCFYPTDKVSDPLWPTFRYREPATVLMWAVEQATLLVILSSFHEVSRTISENQILSLVKNPQMASQCTYTFQTLPWVCEAVWPGLPLTSTPPQLSLLLNGSLNNSHPACPGHSPTVCRGS